MYASDIIAVGILLLMPLSKTPSIGSIGIGSSLAQDPSDESTTSILRRLLNDSNMDPRIRPSVEGDPVQVSCGFFVVSFGSVSEVNMDYTMNIYLRQEWQDDRMVFQKQKVLSLTAKAIEKVWTPDLFFPNEKQAAFHLVTTPNKLMKIYPNGTIVYSIRLTLRLSCPMNLENFPMDHQTCHFKVESYSMNTDEMTLHWFNNTPVEISNNVELPQFDLVEDDIQYGECNSQYKTGSFPCLQASFKLKRQFGFFLLQTYVPTILIVILSWVSFWINMEAVPARISLGVTTVLTMATQLSGSKAAIPRVSYPKAIDIWMSMCMLFVFLALVEYAFVNAMSRKNKPDNAAHKKDDDDVETEKSDNENTIPLMVKTKFEKGSDDEEYVECLVESKSAAEKEKADELPRGLQVLNVRKVFAHRHAARILDKTSRILFPSLFVVFNLVYWPVYLQHKLFT